jgi:2-dehydro-3-deoxyphosphooctonate aldolase (KDO 8-P synthase)
MWPGSARHQLTERSRWRLNSSMSSTCRVGTVTIARGDVTRPLTIIAGPCVLESLQMGLEVGTAVKALCDEFGLAYVFKASFDKANRSSIHSARGPGLERGLEWLAETGSTLGVPVTTDIHESSQAEPVARCVDLLQIPAFLCRQTDLLVAAGRAAADYGRAVNVKKGQFLSPKEMAGPVFKLAQAGCRNVLLTDRGTFFGYGRLVNDFVGISEMMELRVVGPAGEEWGGCPVCLDCTHSTQRPGGAVTDGDWRFAPMLARAGVVTGVDALFLEVHPDPAQAMSDAATQIPLSEVRWVLHAAAALRRELARVCSESGSIAGR